MVLNVGKKLIWVLIFLTLILAILLVILYGLGYLGLGQNFWQLTILPGQPNPTIGHWIVFPEKNYAGLTLVVINNGKTLAREIYQPTKLANGYEAINSQNGIEDLGISSNFVIFDLPYSDRNELSNQAISKYRIDKPFKEIYYCEQPLTEAKTNELINNNNLNSVCQQLNGFL